MTDLFDKLEGRLIGKEGGYSNHPSDRGGETMWGITADVARRYGYSGPMATMPRSTAAAIYRRRYWSEPGFDKVAERSATIAEELFDTGVNMGQAVAALFLQQALNLFNRQGKDYPDILEDGDNGPGTLRALDAFLKRRGKEGETVMVRALNSLQGARYFSITRARPANEDFAYGWFLQRVA